MTGKKTAKKAPAKNKAATRKSTAKKRPAVKKKTKYTAEQVHVMIEQAAYFAALNDGCTKAPVEYWTQAEAEISSMT